MRNNFVKSLVEIIHPNIGILLYHWPMQLLLLINNWINVTRNKKTQIERVEKNAHKLVIRWLIDCFIIISFAMEAIAQISMFLLPRNVNVLTVFVWCLDVVGVSRKNFRHTSRSHTVFLYAKNPLKMARDLPIGSESCWWYQQIYAFIYLFHVLFLALLFSSRICRVIILQFVDVF